MASVDHRGDDVAGVCVCFYVNVWLKKSVFNHACLNMSVSHYFWSVWVPTEVCVCMCVFWLSHCGSGRVEAGWAAMG